MEENINKLRRNAGWIYFGIGIIGIIGVILLKCPNFLSWLIELAENPKFFCVVLWCFSWTFIGIGVGLINTQDHNDEVAKRVWHYILYYPFVLVVGVLASLSVESLSNLKINSYALMALTGLMVGFLGDDLYTFARMFMKK